MVTTIPVETVIEKILARLDTEAEKSPEKIDKGPFLAAAAGITVCFFPAEYIVPILAAIEKWLDAHSARMDAANVSEKIS